MDKFRLGVAQITSTEDLAINADMIAKTYARAHGADLVVFPENSLFTRIQPGAPIRAAALDGTEFQQLQAHVDRAGVPLMLTTPLAGGEGKRLRNATVLLRPVVAPAVVYTKIHLFDVDVPGAPPVRESESFARGAEPAIVEIAGWRIGLSICYDLRFSELYASYAQAVDLILVPSAFLVPTGQAHWHTLLRARAIECQAYVAAPAQSGIHRHGPHERHTFGHSLVVDPWGVVLQELTVTSPDLVVVELKRDRLAEVRRQIPMADHRRL